MAKKTYDFSAFDKKPPSGKKEYDFSAFDEEAKRSPADESSIIDTIADTAVAAGQGATLEFGDEILGGVGAGIDTVFGRSKMEDIMDSYRSNRDTVRERAALGQERSPIASFVGNVAGGIGAGMATGGMGALGSAGLGLRAANVVGKLGSTSQALAKAGIIGAKTGAAAGLGMSEAELSEGDIKGLGKDALIGTGAGAVLGSGLVGLGKAAMVPLSGAKKLSNLAGETSVGLDIKAAFKEGVDGINLITEKGMKAAEARVREISKLLGLETEKTLTKAGSEIGAGQSAARASGQTYDATPQINKVKEIIEILKDSDNPDSIKEVEFLTKYLDNLTLGKEVEIPIQYSKYTPGTAVAAKPSARQALEVEAAKAKASAKVLGQDLKTDIIPSEDETGNMLLTLLKRSDDQVGSGERALPVYDKDGNIVSYDLDPGNQADNFQSKASAKSVMDTPEVEGGFTPSVPGELVTETRKIRRGGVDPSAVSFDKALDIKNTLNDFTGVSGGTPKLNTQQSINALKRTAKELNDQINTATPELATANQKYAAVSQAREIFGLDASSFEKDAATGVKRLTVKGEQAIVNTIKRLGRDTDAGENAANKLSEAVRLLAVADPEMAAALKPAIDKASSTLDLAQKAQRLGFLNKSTYVKSGSIMLANVAGFGATGISNATPEAIKKMASYMMNAGGSSLKLVQPLVDALKKDGVGRNAALFAIQQNPDYRKMIEDYRKTIFKE